MRILVTGSEGTIGRPLVKALREAGHEVWTIDLKHGPHPNHHRADVADYREMVYSQTGMAYLDDTVDVVYHLAAEFGRKNGEEFYERLWRTNVIGTRTLLEFQREARFRLIFASSSEVYGDMPHEELTEDLVGIKRFAPHHENDYALSKWVGEQQVQRFAHQYSLTSLILRFFNAYGPGEHYHPYRSVVCLFCWRLLHGLPIDVYQGYHRVFMYIDDFIRTLVNAADFTENDTVNIGGTEYRSVEELAEIALKATGADPSLVRLVGQEKHNTRNKRPAIHKAVEKFDHKLTVGLEEGVERTVAWMREVYPTWDATTS